MKKLCRNIIVALLFLLSGVGFGGALAVDISASTNLKNACLSKTTDDPSYMESVERANSLKIVKDWEASLGSKSRMALGWDDKTVFINGQCYWIVSFYRSDSKQMQLWKLFRVALTSSDILMMGDDGKYRPITSSPALLK